MATKSTVKLEIVSRHKSLATKNLSALQVHKNGKWVHLKDEFEPVGYTMFFKGGMTKGAPVHDIAVVNGFIHFTDARTGEMFRIKSTEATVIMHTSEDRVN